MPDRIYSIQYNGRIYDVRAPSTAMPSELFAYVRQQAGGSGPQGPKEEENLLEKIPVVGGLLAGAADIPLNVVSGLASTGKSFTDVFGAENMASNALETVAQYAESLTSAQSREDEKTAAAIRKEAEGKGIWEEVKAAARSFAVNPLDTLANVTGSALPFAAAAASGAGIPVIGALGAASGVGIVKGSISDAVYARAKEAGVPDAEAKLMAEEAQAYGGENLDQVALGGALGAVASATGFDKVLGRAIAKSAIEDVVEGVVEKEATRGLARRVATGAGAEALPEAGQAGQERFAQNLAEQRAGYETDLMAGVAGQAAFEGLAGGVLGGIGGIPGQSTPGPIATDEEILSERQGFEADIEATGMPEAQDPAIRARAAELMQSLGVDPVGAVERAIYQRDQQAATRQAEEEDSDGLDVGRGESSVPVSDTTEAGGGLAGDTTESGTGPVGVAGSPAGRSNVQETTSAEPLDEAKRILANKKIKLTERVDVARQLLNDTILSNKIVNDVDQKQYDAAKNQLANGKHGGDPMAALEAVTGKKFIAPTPLGAPAAVAAPISIIPPIDQVSPKAQITEQLAPTGQAAPTATPVPEAAPITQAPIQAVGEATPATPALDLNTQLDEYTSFVSKGQPAPAPLVESIARQYVDAAQATGTEGLVSPDRIPAFSQFIGNESTTVNALLEQAKQSAAAPEQKVSDIAGTLEQNIAAPTPAPVVEDVPGLQLPPEAQEALPTVAEINPTFPEDVQALQAEVNEFNPGFEVRFNPDKVKPYSFGIVGQKKAVGNTAYTSVGGLRKAILNEKPVQPKQVVEGVPVKRMPAGDAGGLNKPTRSFQLQPEKPSIAGKLLPAQQEQIDLLKFEIDAARKEQQINDAQRSELVNMLRTPSLEEMDIYRRGLSNAEIAKRRELRSVWLPVNRIQNEIDKLKAEGNQLGTEEKLLEKQEGLTEAAKAVKKKQFAKRAKDIAKRTKVASAELSEAKSGVYKRARQKLRDAKRKPIMQAAMLKIQLAEGKINKQQYDRMVRDLKPEPYMFRRGKGKATGITLEELNNAVKAITSRWGARLEPKMVQSVADLPPAIRKEIEKLGRTDAFGFYKDGKAYLIADNMNGVEDVAPTLYHEALGHLGLRARFREGLDAILDDIYRTNKGVAALADKFLSANQDLYSTDENPTARAVEEVLASASEAGPLRASRMDKLMKYIKDFARKYLGLDLKFSDREVRTILAMAHQQALSGEGTVMGSSSMMFSTPEQKKAKDTTADAQSDIDTNMEKIATTADQMDMESFSKSKLKSIGDMITGKSLKNWLGGLMSTTASNGWIGRGGLNFMTTDATLAYAQTKLPKPTADALEQAVDIANKMNGTRAAIRRRLNRIRTDFEGYLLSDVDPIIVGKKKLKALPYAMDYGNYYNMDMVSLMNAKSREDALKTDQIWRRYTKRLKEPDLTADKKKEFKEALAKREGQIDGALKAISALSAPGRVLYKRVRDINRDMYDDIQFQMDKRIKNLRDAGLSEETVSEMAISIRAEQERLNDKVNAPSKEDAHKDYPDVPLGLFHREYFAKRRYGDYWLRIKKTKFGEPILKFYETMAERNEDLKAFAKEMNVDLDSDGSTNFLQAGNDVNTQLGEDFDDANPFMVIINKISNIDPDTFTESMKSQLRNDVYQLHLRSTPEGSGRKQFIKSKNRLGWSSDVLRTFGATAEEYASDAVRLRFMPEIDRAITAAKKSVEPVPDVGKDEEDKISVSSNVKMLADDFIKTIKERINGEIEPKPKGLANKIVPWMNQLAFVSFLTAPATALVQVTALPIRVAPHLWSKYGMDNTARAMGRYMNVFKNRPKFESKEKGERKTLRILTLMEAPNIKNSGRHRDALTRATDEYGIIMPLSEFLMGDKRTSQTAAKSGLSDFLQKSYDAMTYLFDTSEQMTREIAFMSTYDLEYDKLADAGLSPEERQNKAIIAAKDVVNYTLGNYTNLNRPPVMKGSELARALFLFKQYSIITTTFFVQASRSIFGPMFGGKTSRAEQVAAMKEMTGVLSMGFLMGGVVGLPLYTLGMMTLQALQDATDDDEDRRERMKKNPLTADSVEMQFRYEWLPEHFGAPTVTAEGGKKINLSDIILNGAVSEATGWNFGSRVSLDLASMWFRAPRDADTWSQTINNALVENIPGASASLNIVSMGEEFSKGNVLKGLEYLPAMVRAPIKAYRLSTEGVRTQNEKIKLKAEELSNAEIIGAALGFNPTQVAKVQQQNRDILNSKRDLETQKADLLGAYKRAVRRIQNGDADGQEKAREAVNDIMKFNKKIGNPYYGISYANMYRSLTGAASEEKYDIQGMGLNQIDSYYADQLLNPK
jgi:hypothetical protein